MKLWRKIYLWVMLIPVIALLIASIVPLALVILITWPIMDETNRVEIFGSISDAIEKLG